MNHLIAVDENRAVGALSLKLQQVDSKARQALIGLLEGIEHPLAEDALLELANLPSWQGGQLEDRIMALDALSRCGSERSVKVLRALTRGWLPLFGKERRQIRDRTVDTLRAIETRLAGEPGGSRPGRSKPVGSEET